MKLFDVREDEISDFIKIDMTPYPRVVLGDGGNKRATWVALGKRDAPSMVIAADDEMPARIAGAS